MVCSHGDAAPPPAGAVCGPREYLILDPDELNALRPQLPSNGEGELNGENRKTKRMRTANRIVQGENFDAPGFIWNGVKERRLSRVIRGLNAWHSKQGRHLLLGAPCAGWGFLRNRPVACHQVSSARCKRDDMLRKQAWFEMPARPVVLFAAAVAGAAALPWIVAASGGGATFLLEDLGSSEARSGRAAQLSRLAGTALIGAGQCCLCWSAGYGLSLLV